MACSKSPLPEVQRKEQQLLEAILEQQKAALEHSKKQTELLQAVFDKVSCGEMRQCQNNGEGTDAARMTQCYIKGFSAQWSKNTKDCILQAVYEFGVLEALEYSDIFRRKDIRRGELMVACWHVTAIENIGEVFNVFEDRGRPNGTAKMAPIRGGLLKTMRINE